MRKMLLPCLQYFSIVSMINEPFDIVRARFSGTEHLSLAMAVAGLQKCPKRVRHGLCTQGVAQSRYYLPPFATADTEIFKRELLIGRRGFLFRGRLGRIVRLAGRQVFFMYGTSRTKASARGKWLFRVFSGGRQRTLPGRHASFQDDLESVDKLKNYRSTEGRLFACWT